MPTHKTFALLASTLALLLLSAPASGQAGSLPDTRLEGLGGDTHVEEIIERVEDVLDQTAHGPAEAREQARTLRRLVAKLERAQRQLLHSMCEARSTPGRDDPLAGEREAIDRAYREKIRQMEREAFGERRPWMEMDETPPGSSGRFECER